MWQSSPAAKTTKPLRTPPTPLHPTSLAPRALPTQGRSLDTPHRLPREMALGATCDNHHSRGSSPGGQQTQPGKAKGSNQQQASPLDDINVFGTVAPVLPKPPHVPASYRHLLHHFQVCSQALTDKLTALVRVEAQKIKFNTRRHFRCQHSKSTHPHPQDTPRTAFWTLQQEVETEVTAATGSGPF